MSNSLSEHHQEQIDNFLKFFRGKLTLHLENVEADFEDTQSDRLSSEEVYNQRDVTDVIDSLCHSVKSSVRSECQSTINMTALLLRQILQQADDRDLQLDLDTSVIEDRALLEKVERLSVAEWSAGGISKAKAKQKMVSLKKKHLEEEQSMRENIENLEKDNESLRKRFQQLQDQCSKAMKEKQKLRDEMDQLRGATTTSSFSNEKVKKLERELEKTQEMLQEQEKLSKEAQQHITESRQFKQMKTMIADKNKMLKRLRERLAQYEQDSDVECDDD